MGTAKDHHNTLSTTGARMAGQAMLLAAALTPGVSWACACGCGVFDVGTSSMFPTGSGGMTYLEYDYMDQKQNRFGASTAPAANNGDKEIRTSFFTVGTQYMFNREWGVQVDVPAFDRYFKTTDSDGNLQSYRHAAIGDVRLRGIYTGLSEDLSTGITFGLKLATGDSTYAHFDPDTEIGTGSYDVLLGIYHLGKITSDNKWVWYTQINLDQPVLTKVNYIPGNEIDSALGAYYNGWGFSGGNKVAPVLSILASVRGNDNGNQADTADSGYKRLIASPGVEGDFGPVRLYADVEVPFVQYYYGNQLAAKEAYKFMIGYNF